MFNDVIWLGIVLKDGETLENQYLKVCVPLRQNIAVKNGQF